MATSKNFLLSIIMRAVDKAAAPIKNVSDKLDKLSKKASAAGGALSTSISLPVVAGFAFATRSLVAFEQGMANVSTLIDTSKENLGEMGAAVLAIGRRTPVAIDELTATLYELRSSGVSAADQFRVLEQAARLGVAGLGTTKEAADLVTSSINAFQLKGEEAAKIYDQIFKTVNAGKTNIAQLSRGFGSVAGTVAASNIKIDEYLSSVAALTTVGLPASEAHTQLRAVIAGLTRTTEKSSKVFRALGARDFKDLITKSGGLVPALERIKKELGGNSSRMLALLGSTEALNAMLGLTGAQNAVFTSTLADMRTGANAVDGAFAKQNKTMASGIARTKNAMTSMGISVGTVLAPTLEKLAGWLERVADWFSKLSPETQTWIVRVAAVAAAVGPTLVVLGKMAQVIGLVATAVRVVGAALLANPIGLAITGIAIAAALVIKYWEPISAFFSDLWLGVTETFRGAWEMIKPIIDAIVGGVRDTIDAVERLAIKAGISEGTALGGSIARFAEPPASRRSLGIGETPPAAAAGVTGSEARVKIDLANAPRGTRVTTDPASTAEVDLSVGYQMVLP